MTTIDFAEKNARIFDALSQKQDYVLLMDPDERDAVHNALVMVGTDRIPLTMVLKKYGMEIPEFKTKAYWYFLRKVTYMEIVSLIGYEPVEMLPRSTTFEANGDLLLKEIITLLLKSIDKDPEGVGDYWVAEDGSEACITTTFSSDPSRSNNGGEYYYYRRFEITPQGVVSRTTSSCDFWSPDSDTKVYKVALDDLNYIFAQANNIVNAVLEGQKEHVCVHCGHRYVHKD